MLVYIHLILLGMIPAVKAALTVQQDWVFPQSPDNSTTINLGSSVTFRWTANLPSWFPTFLPNGNVSHVDVWVTGQNISKGYHKLAADFDVASTTYFSWTNVMIPSAELEIEDVWVLRFLASGDDVLAGTGYQISSPLFYIDDPSKDAITSRSSATSVASTSLTSSVTTATAARSQPANSTTSSVSSASATTSILTPFTSTPRSPTMAASTTSSDTPVSPTDIAVPVAESTALSTPAKAGIGVGAGVGAICLCGLFVYVWTRRRRSNDYATRHGRVHMVDAESSPHMEIQSNVTYGANLKV